MTEATLNIVIALIAVTVAFPATIKSAAFMEVGFKDMVLKSKDDFVGDYCTFVFLFSLLWLLLAAIIFGLIMFPLYQTIAALITYASIALITFVVIKLVKLLKRRKSAKAQKLY